MYRTQNLDKNVTSLSPSQEKARINNQVIFTTGDTVELLESKSVFMLETVIGTGLTIQDGFGNDVLIGITNISQEHSPIRLEGGIKVTAGTVTYIKGFVLGGVRRDIT